MKDGLYRVTLTIDGQPVAAQARVRNGVFQGLGEFAGLVGVFAMPQTVPGAAAEVVAPTLSNEPAPPIEVAPHRRPIDRDLQMVQDEIDAIRRRVRMTAHRAE